MTLNIVTSYDEPKILPTEGSRIYTFSATVSQGNFKINPGDPLITLPPARQGKTLVADMRLFKETTYIHCQYTDTEPWAGLPCL